MLHIFALIFMAFSFQQADAMIANETRSIRCINKTDQTIAVFDAYGSQIFIGAKMSTTVTFYVPAMAQWMVTSAPRQTIYETRIMKKTSKLVFSQHSSSPQQIVCTPELNLFNWLIMRTKLSVRNIASGMTLGLVSPDGDEQVCIQDQQFADNCFYAGLGSTALIALATCIKLNSFRR
jgi:hypothetical protein